MTVHAHPDDEVFATGGMLGKYTAEGIHTINVCCTGGEEGEIVDPALNTEETRTHLREVRKAELEAAARVLGIETLEYLGYRDSGMAGTEANQHPACFHMADPEEATGRLVRLIRTYQPQVLVSYDENGSYGHPDHIKAYQIAALAFDAAGDPSRYTEAGPPWQPSKLYMCGRSTEQFERWRAMAEELDLDVPWLRNPPPPDSPPRGIPSERITTRLDVVAFAERKVAALRCHRTQIAPVFFLFDARPEIVLRAFGDEEYVRVRSSVDAPLPEQDLFAGLR
jgi:mycothiol conjugate amidase Mca